MYNERSVWAKIVIFSVVIILFIVLHYINILKPVEGLLTSALKPLQVPLYRFSIYLSDSETLYDKNELISENNQLKQDVNDLVKKNSELETYIDENEILKQQITFLEDNQLSYQTAKIISKYSGSNKQIVVINQGENVGIKVGFPVIAGNGVLIGKIDEVSANTAKVLLITSNVSEIAAQIENELNTPGIIKGKHGLSMAMELIPKQDEITDKSIVITSGIENNIPKGLIIGQIENITEKPGDLFKEADIIPLIDFSRLSVVSIVK
ncbi:MAG: rod shape-determining protein MreC [Patescibacteria group bacterium]